MIIIKLFPPILGLVGLVCILGIYTSAFTSIYLLLLEKMKNEYSQQEKENVS